MNDAELLSEQERHINSVIKYEAKRRPGLMVIASRFISALFSHNEPKPKSRTIVCLLPAYELENEVDKTLASLVKQTRRIDRIVVIVNGDKKNSTAYNKALPFAKVFPNVTVDYPRGLAGKANALNWGWRHYCKKLTDVDMVLGVDADVVCDLDMVAQLEEELLEDPKAGGVMARYSFAIPSGKLRRSEKSLLYNQRHEFTMAGIRHQLHGFTSEILGGQATLFRADVLKAAAATTKGNCPWDNTSKVEDAELTRTVQSLGYNARTSRVARAWVGAMLTPQSWQQQRRKWEDGHLEDLTREFHPVKDARRWAEQLALGGNLLIRIIFFCLLTVSLAQGKYLFIWVWITPMLLSVIQSFLVALKTPDHTLGEIVRSLLFMPDEIYYLRTLSVWLNSLIIAILNVSRDGWGNQIKSEYGNRRGAPAGWLLIICAISLPACLALVLSRYVNPVGFDIFLNTAWAALTIMTMFPILSMLMRIVQMLRHWRILKP